MTIFAPGPFATGDGQAWQGSCEQLHRELAALPWLTPIAVKVVGGTFDPAKLSSPYSLFMRQVPANDLRDWPAIHAWAGQLVARL